MQRLQVATLLLILMRVTQAMAARAPAPPMRETEIFAWLASDLTSHRIAGMVQERGIDFAVTPDDLAQLRVAGTGYELTHALEIARVTRPNNIAPAFEALQSEIIRHVGLATAAFRAGQFAEEPFPESPSLTLIRFSSCLLTGRRFVRFPPQAADEYRTAILLDPRNADLQVGLSRSLSAEGRPQEGSGIRDRRAALGPGQWLGLLRLCYNPR